MYFRLPPQLEAFFCNLPSNFLSTTTTTKPFVPSIQDRLPDPKENYAESGTWISFLYSFLSSSMSSLRPLASISFRITSIHVFLGLSCALAGQTHLQVYVAHDQTIIGGFLSSSLLQRLRLSQYEYPHFSPYLSSCYHTSNEACASLLHLSYGHDVSL